MSLGAPVSGGIWRPKPVGLAASIVIDSTTKHEVRYVRVMTAAARVFDPREVRAPYSICQGPKAQGKSVRGRGLWRYVLTL